MSSIRPERELSILDLLHIVWRRRGLIVLVMTIGVGVTFGVLQLVPKTFVARALVLIDPDQTKADSTAPSLGQVSLDHAMVDSQVQLLGSRGLARDVVRKLGLDAEGELGAPPWRPIDAFQEVATRLTGGPVTAAETAAGDRVGRDDLLIDRFLERLRVAREGKTYVIVVSYASSDPELSARVANEVATRYLSTQLSSKLDKAKRSIGWLGDRYEQAKAAHEADILALQQWRQRYIVAKGDRTGREGEALVQLDRELIQASVDRAAREAKLHSLRDLVRRGDFATNIDEVGPSSFLQNLLALKASTLRRLSELSSQYGDRHPKIVDARRERAELDERIGHEQASMLREYETTVQVARAKEQTLTRELERLKQRSAEQDNAGQQLRILEQAAEQSRRLVDSYLVKMEASVQGEAAQQADARVISEAVAPSAPLFPKPQLVLSVSATVSLIMALIAVYLAELAERGFRTAAEVESELRLPSLGTVPTLKRRTADEPPEQYIVERPNSRMAEAIRGLLGSLLVDRREGRGRVVMLTSCLPGEGKTTLSMSLGRLAASEGLRTLLIDADLRHPRVHELFGPRLQAGLAEVLQGEVTIEQAIKRDERTGLVVLPGSKRLGQPTKLFGENGIGRLLEAARAKFDLIIVDSAPLLAVADGRLVALSVDSIVLVVRWQRTPRSLAAHCLAGLAPVKERIKGVILNQVDLKKQARYGYGETASAQYRIAGYYTD